MVLIKKVDGIDVPMTEAEEAEIRAFWAENERKEAEQAKEQQRKHTLQQKYKDPLEALEKLCKHLNIDYEKLQD